MATKTMTAARAFGELSRHAEKIKNDEHQLAGEGSQGDLWAQGDVGLLKFDAVPAGSTVVANPALQLAPGTTQGSRHCLTSLTGVTVYALANATPLDGPVLDCAGPITVEHPEHGDWTFPAGVYAVVYQRAFAAEIRRVQD